MSKRLLDYDPLTGITQWFHMDDTDDSFVIQNEQDVTEIVELNKLQANHFSSGKDTWGDGFDHRTKVASIPLNIYMDLKQRGILRDPAAFKRWLNDGSNAAFRTRPGTI